MSHETMNDLPENVRSQVSDLLNNRLAEAIDLQTQVKQAHWNVKGPQFIALHKLFDEINDAVVEYVDLLAERVVQLGGTAEGTARVVAERSELPEYPLTISTGEEHVWALSSALSNFGERIRRAIDQTADLATWTRRTSARRSRAAPTSGCGSSNRTPKGPCGRTSRADRAVKLGRGAVGLPHDFFDRRGEELVAEHHRLSIHEHIAHVTRARRVHDERYRVAHRRVEVRLAQVEDDQVGALAGGDRADLGFEAERAGAPERGELEHPTGGERVGAEPWLLDQGGEAHLGEHVEPVVAGRAVRPDGDLAPRGEQLRHLRHAARELQVGRRAVHHRGALAREARRFVRVHPHAVGECRTRARDPDRVEVGDLLEPRGAQHRLALDDRLGGMGVQLRVEPLGQLARGPEQRSRAAGHETRGEAHP